MKPSLQLRISQSLTMTPQLQQAIRLLQLSTLDLQQEIQDAIEKNPMLELEEEHSDDTQADKAPALPSDHDSFGMGSNSWENHHTGSQQHHDSEEDSPEPYGAIIQGCSLQEHLCWQLELTPMSEVDKQIAIQLIDGIDEDGYLRIVLEDVITESIEYDEVESVLHHLQQFDPPGVAARNLSECLVLQLKQFPDETPFRALAIKIATDNLELLASRNPTALLKNHDLSREDFNRVLQLIQSLNPRPGSSIAPSQSEHVVLDIIVRKVNDRWLAQLNSDVFPKVRINSQYAALARAAETSTDGQFMRGQLQEARWLLKSIESRHQTLVKVAQCIVDRQANFFEFGAEAMRPLVLSDVATEVEMHESTISRVTTQKFMHTPRGVFELKYFFSSHVTTDAGGECSSTAIRALIKKLVSAENPEKPLSDSKIAALLKEQGIQVARRTIAKYRESMNVASSTDRKRFKLDQ